MRLPAPLIIGAGPAGCAAAITLARMGKSAVMVDRDREVGDPLCGGFLSWKTAEQLRGLGLDFVALGAHELRELRLLTGSSCASTMLPSPAFGLSRHALDSALRARALATGASLEVDTIRQIAGTTAMGDGREWRSESIFLASGKHDIRGQTRPRDSADPALGLRLRLPASPDQTRLLSGAIELHLFKGGYAGIVLQEDGSANICLAVRKSLLTQSGGKLPDLLELLARQSPQFGDRLQDGWRSARIDTIGAVPYGWIANSSESGVFRLGDQAAVIPSLAGEGMSIALASGIQAAHFWHDGGEQAAQSFQADFARRAAKPVKAARIARRLVESPMTQPATLAITRHLPALIGRLMGLTRIPLDS